MSEYDPFDPFDAQPVAEQPPAGMEAALAAITEPGRALSVASRAAELGIDPRDPAWILIRAAVDVERLTGTATQAAQAAQAAAQQVQDAVGSIPDRVLEGASRAAADAHGEIAQGVAQGVAALDERFVAGGQAIVQAIHNASQRGARAIEQAGGTLAGRLDQEVAQRVQQGADQFAQAAAHAAALAARSALGRRAVGSLALAGALLVGAALLGAGGAVAVMGPVLHRVAPAPFTMAANGKPACGWISLNGTPNFVCGVTPPGPAPAGAPAASPLR